MAVDSRRQALPQLQHSLFFNDEGGCLDEAAFLDHVVDDLNLHAGFGEVQGVGHCEREVGR